MKNSAKLAMSLAPIAALASVGSVAVTDVSAAEAQTISEVVYSYDGQTVVVEFSQLSSAMLDGEGDMYDFATNNQISALGLGNGEYIDFMSYASAVLDGDNVTDILSDLSENPIDEGTVEAYVALDGFDEDGNPIISGDDAIVPEVISID